ncbi:MAG: AAA family ATPase [Ruminococcus sp.]|nr:AAA family ATPase [Ruminococcus sp.]
MLLLDEPVTGLDPKAQTDLYELIAKLNREGITIIMVSHDVAASVKYASHILHIGSHKQLFSVKLLITSQVEQVRYS